MPQPQKPPGQPPVAAAISDVPSPGSPSPSDDSSPGSEQHEPENRLSRQLDEAEDQHISKMEENVKRQREMNNAGKDWRKMNKARIKKVKTAAKQDYQRNASKITEHETTLAGHEGQLATLENQLTAQAGLLATHDDHLATHEGQLTAHDGQLAAQANVLDDHEKKHKSHHNRIAKVEAGYGKHDEHLKRIEAKYEEHAEVLEQVKKDNKWRGVAVAGIGVAALLGIAVLTLDQIFGKKNDMTSEKGNGKDRRHAREWHVVEDDMDDHELDKYRK